MVGRQATILDLLAKKRVKPRTQARRSHRAADPLCYTSQPIPTISSVMIEIAIQ
jgi:hypothetical protein